MRIITFGILWLFLQNNTTAQSLLVKGKVYGAIDSIYQPLEAARLQTIDKKYQAVADQQGSFTILVEDSTGELLVTHYGYHTEKVQYDLGRRNNSVSVRMRIKSPVVRPLLPGDSIPDFLWDLPLRVVNHPAGRTVVTLREYQDKALIVMDIWSRACKPCIESIDKLQSIQQRYPQLAVLTVHNDVADRAMPVIQKRGWKTPAFVGENTQPLILSFFYQHNIMGGVVYIRQGKVEAITMGSKNDGNLEKIDKMFQGRSVDFSSTIPFTYLEQRTIYEQRLQAAIAAGR